jgi:beta-N-acetylhexosaminidase
MTLGPVMVDLGGIALEPEERDMLAHPQVGSVILFARNYESPAQLSRLVAEVHAIRSPSLLVAVDQEGGRVQRFRDGFTRLPPLREIGRRYTSDRATGLGLARELGWLMAAELRAVGVDMSFAPCVDLDYGVSSVIGDRALHADAGAVGELAVAYMLGMRDAGMAATAKHFPGHGAVAADSHVALPVDRREWPDVQADFGPYRRLIANGLPSVMVAHVVFPAVDALPASLSGRAGRARDAGCDVLPVCNDREAATALLDAMRVAPDPVSQMRLARLHGRDAGPDPVERDARWQGAVAAARSLVDRPALELEGDRPA